MAIYLDPKNDLVFKRIFGERPHLLKSFLNALMPLDEGQLIETVEYLTSESVPENPLKKFSIVDVRCKDNYGRYFIVEMQMEWNTAFPNRMLYNLAHTYTRQLNRGEKFNELQPVYGLGLLNEVFDDNTEEYYHRYQLVNTKNMDEIINGMEIIMVELPKFKPETMTEKRMAALWLRFLNEVKNHTTHVSEDLLSNEEIHEALDICEMATFTDAEMDRYQYYRMALWSDWMRNNENFKKGFTYGEKRRVALEKKVSDKELELEAKAKEIEERDKELEERNKEIEERNKEIEERNKEIEERNKELEAQAKEIEKLKQQLKDKK